MRAVVFDRYGPPEVLRLDEVDRPTPDDDQILVRVRATTVNRADCHLRSASPTGSASSIRSSTAAVSCARGRERS